MPTFKRGCNQVLMTGATTLTYKRTSYEPPTFASWEEHPALITAFDCLNLYNQWVAERVLPNAFQWIAEHRDDVYAGLSPKQKDGCRGCCGAGRMLIPPQTTSPPPPIEPGVE